MASVEHQGIEIVYDDMGDGERTYLLVHGWACDRTCWAPQIEYLSKSNRVLTVDLRGHGDSDKPSDDYLISAYADDLAFLLRSLNLTKTIAIGHSMGGISVLELAASHGDLLSGIVMIDPVPLIMSDDFRSGLELVATSLESGEIEACRQFITQSLFLPTSEPGLVASISALMLRTPYIAARGLRGILKFDGVGTATRCSVPALHIAASQPLNAPHQMSQLIPLVIHGWTVATGHFNHLEAPQQVNPMIDAFVRHHLGGTQ